MLYKIGCFIVVWSSDMTPPAIQETFEFINDCKA